MVVYRKTYTTKLSLEQIVSNLSKITGNVSDLDKEILFFKGYVNYDNFKLEPDTMDRFRCTTPKVVGSFLHHNNKVEIKMKLLYPHIILKIILFYILAILCINIINVGTILFSNKLYDTLFIFVILIVLDLILYVISSLKLISNFKLFIQAK